jgi:hypothetical protein
MLQWGGESLPNQVISLLEENFKLTNRDKDILNKTTRELNRSDRQYFFQELKPREGEFKEFFKKELHNSDGQVLKEMVVANLLERGGDPSIADGLLMDVLGRLEVYHQLREKAEEQGVKLKALTNFGGMGLLIGMVGLTAAVILYFLNR